MKEVNQWAARALHDCGVERTPDEVGDFLGQAIVEFRTMARQRGIQVPDDDAELMRMIGGTPDAKKWWLDAQGEHE